MTNPELRRQVINIYKGMPILGTPKTGFMHLIGSIYDGRNGLGGLTFR
jgi:hypothetical protein